MIPDNARAVVNLPAATPPWRKINSTRLTYDVQSKSYQRHCRGTGRCFAEAAPTSLRRNPAL